MIEDHLPLETCANYETEHRVLYVQLEGYTGEPGSVSHTEVENGLLYDVDHQGRRIGVEILLREPLDIFSGSSGGTRTGVHPFYAPRFIQGAT